MNEQARKNGNSHALVVGGSGMLSGVSLHLAEQGYIVSVVGRQPDRLQALVDAAKDAPGRISPISVDYGEADRFRELLSNAVAAHGPITIAVCWIHSTAQEAPRVVADVVASDAVPCRYFHIRGSAGADPPVEGGRAAEWLDQYPTLLYRQVILGFVVNDSASRWLTHDEISAGVISAIDQNAEYTIVGTVEPWSMRP